MIEEYPGAVPADLCRRIVEKFESDARKGPSTVGNAGFVSDRRRGTLLRVDQDLLDWRPLVQEAFAPVQRCLDLYMAKYESVRIIADRPGLVCKYPLIERTGPDDGFDWHMDADDGTRERVLAVLIYLTDVAGGGYTEFKFQNRRIAPKAGKLAMFPPFWTHYHRGVPPTAGAKYVMSFFWTYPPRAEPAPEPRRGLFDRLRGKGA
jgi:hypothetical protein